MKSTIDTYIATVHLAGNHFCSRLLWVVAVLLMFGAAACADETPQGCLEWRWIGKMPKAAVTCPAADGWSAEHVFASFPETQAAELGKYCLYTAMSAAADDQELTRLLNRKKLKQIGRDCVAVAPQSVGGQLGELHWSTLEAHFLSQAGAINDDLLGPNKVQLVVIDTNPTNDEDPHLESGNSAHGNALLSMADRLLCADAPAGTCGVDVHSRLGLAFQVVNSQSPTASVIDDQVGGYVGSLSRLAQAIQVEVRDWAVGGAAHPLIINLSLGWNPAFGGLEPPANMALGPRLVYAALQDASCRGALVFAAAGNRDGAFVPQYEPLLPAAWEANAAPGTTACGHLLGSTQPFGAANMAGGYRPLLYAVGGLESDWSPLDNARPFSHPRLAAYGDHATVINSLATRDSSTATLTGTSVSTLLASANAAVAWSWDTTGLSAHQIVEEIYTAANGLGRAADLCLNPGVGTCAGASRQVKRLSLCRTWDYVSGAKETCPSPQTPVTINADYSNFDAAAVQIHLDDLTVVSTPPACDGVTVWHDGSANAANAIACPHLVLPSAIDEPALLPQPGSSMCPECPASAAEAEVVKRALTYAERKQATQNTQLRIEIDPQLIGQATDATLGINGTLYRIHSGPLNAGDKLLVEGLEGRGPLDNAFVSFAVNGVIARSATLLQVQ